MQIRYYSEKDDENWNNYVKNHHDSFHAHLICWKYIIEMTYGCHPYYMLAEWKNDIVGVLPLFFIKSRIFGRHLVSMPYLTYGGILVDNSEVGSELMTKAYNLAIDLDCNLELRQTRKLDLHFPEENELEINQSRLSMRLPLPKTSDELFASFKSKLRSQIRRPQKEGMTFELGGKEKINDFYHILSINMRDLGSPVHSKNLFLNIMKFSYNTSRIGVVYLNKKPVAAGLITYINDFVEIPWASSLRKYNRFSPNMLLYWGLLEFAVNNQFKTFDFGRSRADASTYQFKKQWGSHPVGLNWYSMQKTEGKNSEYKKKIFTSTWSKLPVRITKFIGPYIRNGISL